MISNSLLSSARFNVLTAMKIHVMVFRVVALSGGDVGYCHFRGAMLPSSSPRRWREHVLQNVPSSG
jgi:hypothetical protein